jgi:hypothetical protein
MQPKEITDLQDVIRREHGCESKYSRTVHVCEAFQKKTAWDGFVRVFRLVEHPKARRCYAWSYRKENEIKSVAVLEIPPVDSPESAVKAAIAAKARSPEN